MYACGQLLINVSVLDLSTHEVSIVPGSKDLFSPRWSPNGNYLAALSADSQKLMLFDFRTQNGAVWVDEDHTVGFSNWSRHSKYIYYDWAFGKDQSFRRLKVGEHKSEQLLSLKGLRRYFNWMGSWAGITPDGTPLFVRDTSTQEIYALELQQTITHANHIRTKVTPADPLSLRLTREKAPNTEPPKLGQTDEGQCG
jgi:hypothetical protein